MNLADMVRGTGDWVAPAPFVILGGGGHAKVVVGVLLRLGYRVLGYTDVARRGTILGIGCLGTDEDLPAILEAHPVCAAAMGLGKVDTSATRLELQRCVSALGFSFPPIVAPGALVNQEVTLGAGAVVLDGAVVNCGASCGDGCIINSNATVEHDCVLGMNVHVAPGAVLSGGVSVGDHCMIGAGAVVVQYLSVAAGTLIAAGATVVRDIDEPGTYAGCPARRIA